MKVITDYIKSIKNKPIPDNHIKVDHTTTQLQFEGYLKTDSLIVYTFTEQSRRLEQQIKHNLFFNKSDFVIESGKHIHKHRYSPTDTLVILEKWGYGGDLKFK